MSECMKKERKRKKGKKEQMSEWIKKERMSRCEQTWKEGMRKTWKGGWATRRRLGGDLGFLAHRPLPFLAFDLLSEEVLTHWRADVVWGPAISFLLRTLRVLGLYGGSGRGRDWFRYWLVFTSTGSFWLLFRFGFYVWLWVSTCRTSRRVSGPQISVALSI